MLLESTYINEKVTPFMTNDQLESIMTPLIEPKYHSNIKDWLYYAKPNEKKRFIYSF